MSECEVVSLEQYGRLVKAMKPGEYRIPQELVDRVKANKQKESDNE